MKPIFRMWLIVIVLASSLVLGGLVVQHSTAKACGTYTVPGSAANIPILLTSHINVSFSLVLMYNSCNGTNWGQLTLPGGYLSDTYSLTVYVERASGPDGGDLTQHSAADCGQIFQCDSPTVYSPDNKARAYFILSSFSGDVQQLELYTDWF